MARVKNESGKRPRTVSLDKRRKHRNGLPDFTLRDAPSLKYRSPRLKEDFVDYVRETLVPKLGDLGPYKLDSKTELIAQIVAALILADSRGKVIADTRDKNDKEAAKRVPRWDNLIDARFCKKCLGSEQSKKVTRYTSTPKLRRTLKGWSEGRIIDDSLHFGSSSDPNEYSLIRLKKRKEDRRMNEPVTMPFPPELAPWLDYREKHIDYINRQNLRHSWQYTTIDARGKTITCQPLVQLQEQHIGYFNGMKRLYTPGQYGAQSLSREERKTLLIDGEPVVELDYKCSLLRLAYHTYGADLAIEDLYQPEAIFRRVYASSSQLLKDHARALVKKATIIAMNCCEERRAQAALNEFIRDTPQLIPALENEQIAPKDVLKRVVRLHEPYYCYLLYNHRGLGCLLTEALFSLESTIITNVCLRFAAAGKETVTEDIVLEDGTQTYAVDSWGKPVLPIHDAVVCKEEDAEFARETMIAEYRRLMKFDPVVEIEH